MTEGRSGGGFALYGWLRRWLGNPFQRTDPGHSSNHGIHSLIESVADSAFDGHMSLAHDDLKTVWVIAQMSADFRADAGFEHGIRDVLAGRLDPVTHFVKQSSCSIREIPSVFARLLGGLFDAALETVPKNGPSPMTEAGIQQVHGSGTQSEKRGGTKQFHAVLLLQMQCTTLWLPGVYNHH